MDRHVTRFSELRPPDVKDAKFDVDIRPVKAQGFAHPHCCCHQQADEGRVGILKESGVVEFGEGFFNLFAAIDVRWLTTVTMREKSWRGNFGEWIDGAMPDGKAPDYA